MKKSEHAGRVLTHPSLPAELDHPQSASDNRAKEKEGKEWHYAKSYRANAITSSNISRCLAVDDRDGCSAAEKKKRSAEDQRGSCLFWIWRQRDKKKICNRDRRTKTEQEQNQASHTEQSTGMINGVQNDA